MNFKQIIEKLEKKYETKAEAARAIDQDPQALLDAKKQKRGLPDKSCVKMAQILGMDGLKVIAAKEEWMAKTKEDREFWHPLANAAGIGAISVAIATSFFAPSPAQAAQTLESSETPMCIMSNIRRRISRNLWARLSIAFGNWRASFDNYYFLDHASPA